MSLDPAAASGLAGDEILRRKFGAPDIPVESSLPEDMTREIQSLELFLIATSNRAGQCDSSYRGKGKGVPAVKVLDPRTIVFPHCMGNGTFRSLGNILQNSHIGLLFMDMQTGRRIRINGQAKLGEDPESLKWFPHSLLIVKVAIEEPYRQNRPARPARPPGGMT